MEGGSAQKRRRRRLHYMEKKDDEKTETATDCISLLPDHLLHEILAFLPTKITVSTALLSRRWRTVWTTSPDISITHQYPAFIGSALRLRDSAVPLRTFSLVAFRNATVILPVQLHFWIRCATNSALQCLTITVCSLGGGGAGAFFPHQNFDLSTFFPRQNFDVIPSAVFCLPSLRVLVLSFPGEITHLEWPATAFLPSLQRLELFDLNLILASKDVISKSCPALRYWRMSLYATTTRELDVNCPLLEVFELTTLIGSTGVFSICGRNLREVRVRQESAYSAPPYLKMSAPGLRTLEWVGPLPLSFAAADDFLLPNSLVSSLTMQTSEGTLVEFDLKKTLLDGDGGGNHKLSMLRINRLILPTRSITKVLGKLVFDRINQENLPDQEYENLKHLELSAFFGEFDSLGVAFLLRKFSKIETLQISLSRECSKDFSQSKDFYNYFEAKGGFGRGGYWDGQNCCLEKLVCAAMHDFSGELYEYDFLEFLFRASTSLRKVTIALESHANLFSVNILQSMELLHRSFPHIKIVIL